MLSSSAMDVTRAFQRVLLAGVLLFFLCPVGVDDDDVELNVLGCRADILGTNCDQCVSMVQCCFTSTETIRLIGMGSPGRPTRISHIS